MKTLFWRCLVVIFVILGFIGALLPGMPTTVFLILAAWAASKGWPQMDAWLLNHPKYGATLRAWRANGSHALNVAPYLGWLINQASICGQPLDAAQAAKIRKTVVGIPGNSAPIKPRMTKITTKQRQNNVFIPLS